MNPNDKQFLFSNFLDQGRLIEFHDLEGIRIGIRSLNAQEVDLILFQYKLEPTNDILKEAQAPSLFAKKFLYSVSGKILSAKEREELADSLHYDILKALFLKWQKLQEHLDEIGDEIEEYSKNPISRMKYKLCKLFQTIPSNPLVRDMDPLTRAWFYHNILEDEKELSNLMYDKVEYAVSFWDSKAAGKQRKIRLKAQGYDIKDSDLIQSTHFDQELLNELKELDPNLDTSQIKSLDDYVKFAQEVPFEEDIESNKGGSKYSEEDKANLMGWLEREKGSPLTETERQITIYKLDNGQPINLKQILDEALDMDTSNSSLSDIAESLPDLDDI